MPLLVGGFFLLFSVFGLVLFIVARFEDVRAVVAQFGDGFADVGKGFVAAFFRVGVSGIPAAHEFFQGGDVEVAVMEVVFESRHEARHEAAILADAVATER